MLSKKATIYHKGQNQFNQKKHHEKVHSRDHQKGEPGFQL
jgi:hypothetical protein